MKKSLLSVLMIAMAAMANVSAAPVSKVQAQGKAKAFLQAKGVALQGELAAIDGPRKTGTSRDGSACYYVFNNGQNGGFVIVSGDSRTRDILAYSDTWRFDEENIAPATQAMLADYKEAITLLGEDNSDTEEQHTPNYQAYGTTNTPVAKLLTSRWDQDTPFNRTCPVSSSTRTMAGCVGVAMAQVLYYYRNRMPAKTTKEITAYASNQTTVKKGTAYNWAYMWDSYVPSLSTTQLNAVANLILYSGMAVKSSYGVSVTGASFANVGTTMVSYFDFSDNYKYVSRTEYTAQKWESMLADELAAARPIIYNGVGRTLNHAFILDGYDGMGLFHVNWGWGGRADGYYALNVLNPESDRNGEGEVDEDALTIKQQAIIGLQPTNGYFEGDVTPELTSTINTVKSPNVTVTFKNNTAAEGDFAYGLGYYDADRLVQPLKVIEGGDVTVPANSSTGAVTFALATTDFSKLKLAKGTYELFPIYRLKGSEDWTRCANTTSNYVAATYASSVTASLAAYTYSLKASDFYFSGSQVKGVSQPVHVKITNEGDKDYIGYVYLFASTTTAKGTRKSYNSVIIGPGETVDALFSFTPTAAAKHNVWIASDASASNVIGSSSVTIKTGTVKRGLKVTGFSVENINPAKAKQLLSDRFKGKATITNVGTGTFSGKLTFFFRRKLPSAATSAYASCDETVYTVTIPEGESTVVEFDYDNLSTEWMYGLSMRYWTDWATLTNGGQLGYTVLKSIKNYAADGTVQGQLLGSETTFTAPTDAAAVDLTGFASSISKVVPTKNPNTLYFIGEDEKVPVGLEGKNVVKGNNADEVNLTDGYAFYAPKSFQASKVNYTRYSQIGTNGVGGWEVLLLPFDATSLTYKGIGLRWFLSDNDSGKNLWIKEFSSVQGYGTVCFDYAQSLKANKPYIMAVPDSHWGEIFNLVGKPLVFSAENATVEKTENVVTGSDYVNFHGTFHKRDNVAAYVLDSQGRNFEFKTSAIQPFRGYFVSGDNDGESANLNIGSETGISEMTMMPLAAEGETVAVYNINGVKVASVTVSGGAVNLDALPHGVYIVKGHKLIK